MDHQRTINLNILFKDKKQQNYIFFKMIKGVHLQMSQGKVVPKEKTVRSFPFFFKGGPSDLGTNIYKNIEKSSLYSQSLLIFIQKTP